MDKQLAQLVKEMRDTQKEYFSTRKKSALIRAKDLEWKVDNYLIEKYSDL